MKIQRCLKSIALIILLASPSIGLAVNWYNKSMGQLQSTYDGADCFYFTLDGVSEADPVKPGDPWFAIPRSQYGAKDTYAMLLAAKLSGQVINVTTRGTLSCGYATVGVVWMP